MKATLKIENVQELRGNHRDAECKNGITTGYKAFTIIGGLGAFQKNRGRRIQKSG